MWAGIDLATHHIICRQVHDVALDTIKAINACLICRLLNLEIITCQQFLWDIVCVCVLCVHVNSLSQFWRVCRLKQDRNCVNCLTFAPAMDSAIALMVWPTKLFISPELHMDYCPCDNHVESNHTPFADAVSGYQPPFDPPLGVEPRTHGLGNRCSIL